MTISKVLFSSEKQDWGTPPELWNALNSEFDFMLDAATRPSNPLKTPAFLTENDNALSVPWQRRTYCNPPYGRQIEKWIRKAYIEWRNGNLVVMFLPSRTGTRWFHAFIYNRPRVETRFLKGRFRMFNYDTNTYSKNVAPFDSMVVIFRP